MDILFTKITHVYTAIYNYLYFLDICFTIYSFPTSIENNF